MRDERDIRKVLEKMDEHEKFITDDFRRFGFDNFRSGLEFALGLDKGSVMDLSVGHVKLGDRIVDLKER